MTLTCRHVNCRSWPLGLGGPGPEGPLISSACFQDTCCTGRVCPSCPQMRFSSQRPPRSPSLTPLSFHTEQLLGQHLLGSGGGKTWGASCSDGVPLPVPQDKRVLGLSVLT